MTAKKGPQPLPFRFFAYDAAWTTLMRHNRVRTSYFYDASSSSWKVEYPSTPFQVAFGNQDDNWVISERERSGNEMVLHYFSWEVFYGLPVDQKWKIEIEHQIAHINLQIRHRSAFSSAGKHGALDCWPEDNIMQSET